MRVVFQVLKTGSGNDVYFERLAEALKKVNIDSKINYYHKYFQYFPSLLKFFKKNSRGDIVHSNVEYGWVFKQDNKPLVVTLHHCVFDKEYQKLTTLPQKAFHYFILRNNIKKTLNIADKKIAVSNYTKNSFKKEFGENDITVIYNFIDTDKYKPLPLTSANNKFKLLFVGNLTKRKGADLLPKIMKRLGENYELYYTSGLRTKIPDGFNQPNMIPLGKLTEDELIREYNRSDALLFPTRLEGFGYCVLEAMACGKPVITTNCSSIPELITDSNGFLSKKNDLGDMVKNILYLKNHQELKPILSKNNRQKVISKFSIYIIIKQYEKLYKRI